MSFILNSLFYKVIMFAVLTVGLYFLYLKMRRIPMLLKNVPKANLSLFEVVFGQGITTTVLYTRLLEFRKEHGKIFWTMIGIEEMLFVADAKLAEVILSSQKCIDKSRSYQYFHNWLGTGLLTSAGEKWRNHRKIITPAFHFKILEDFVPSFDSASEVLVEKLKKEIGKESTDIFPYITLCTLDAVCESAMGTTVNAQKNENSLYVRSVKEMCRIMIDRTINILGQFDLTYACTKDYRLEGAALKVLHDYTNSVIKTRKLEMKNENAPILEDDIGIKKKRAFLDLLLQYSKDEITLSDRDIREEVDTFMFEGHDTTSAAISFCLYLLANNPKCQNKAFSEIREIFRDDRHRKVTFKDLHEMKYLELVLKEVLRLYPSVPFYARELKQDLVYDDIVLPEGLTVVVLPYVMQLDPDYFPNPEVFDPERFEIESAKGRNPFCYIPFSAGPRNCIGQKFAMLSMKSTISKILRHYELLSVDHRLELAAETILKSKNGVRISFKYRIWE